MTRKWSLFAAGCLFLTHGCGGAATGGETSSDVPACDDVVGLQALEVSGEGGTIQTIAGSGADATDDEDTDADEWVDCPISALEANLDTPIDSTLGPDGRLYILDWNGHKIRVLGDDGMIAFLAGTGFEGDACEAPNSDGTCPAIKSELNHMTDVTFDSEGRMVIAAWHNSKIKRVDFSTDLMEDLCGTGGRQFLGDDGPCEVSGVDAVAFDLPSAVVYDQAGNLFISDQANQVVRRLGIDGIVKTVVGQCPGETGDFGCLEGQGYEGDDGPALSAKLNNHMGQGTDPQGKIAMDNDGNLYIADSGNHLVRKVSPGSDGIIGDGDSGEEMITRVAGSLEAGYSGDGGPATSALLQGPRDVEVAEDGTIYIADTINNCVRKVDPAGVITTVAGQCGELGGFDGDGGPATAAKLNRPYGIELDGDGNLFIADSLNYRIRVVYKTATLSTIQEDIFTPHCASCHQPGGEGYVQTSPFPLDLSSAEASFSGLVGVMSVQNQCGIAADQPCGLRVASGDADDSYLIKKLEGEEISFATDLMPRNATPLSSEEIQAIRDWINAGAADN